MVELFLSKLWRARRIPALIALAAAIAVPAAASNMGFKQRVIILADPEPSLYWLSIPYRYAPQDVGVPGVVDAEDLCQDVDPGGVSSVVRWDDASSTFVEHSCGDAMPFALTPGIGYGLRVVADWNILAEIGGGHDEGFTYSIPPSGGGQLTWLSVPFHLRVPENGSALAVSAEDLCRQIGSSDTFAIVRWDEETDAYQAYGCGSAFEEPFEVERGRSYGVVNRSGETIDWQPIHF